MLSKVKAFLLTHELLIFILCLVALLRVPSLIEPYWYGDEGIYLTLGNGIRHGLILYRDIHDNKPPGIYLIAAVAGSLFWFRMILLAWNLTSIAVFHWLASRVLRVKTLKPWRVFSYDFPKPTLVTLVTLLFGLLPFLTEGNIANGEIFMVLPVLIGFALLFKMSESRERKRQLQLSALAGLAFSAAFLIKVPAVFEAVAAGFFFFLYPSGAKGNLAEKGKWILCNIFHWKPWIYAGMFLLPIVLSIVYYTMMGAGKAYLGAALFQNVGYLSSWTTGTQQASLSATGLKGRAVALLGTTLILLFSSPLVSESIVFTLLWFAFALFAALLSERPYPHYMMQVVAPLALLVAVVIQNLTTLKKKDARQRFVNVALGLIAAGALVTGIMIFKFWHYSIPPYYQNYFSYISGKISKDQYLTFFDPTLPEIYRLATYIRTYTEDKDRIFIWGDLPSLYALTRRLPPGRYTAAYHVKDFNGFDETYTTILKVSPKFILIDKRIAPFPHLDGLLVDSYVSIYASRDFVLYRRTVL